MEELANFHYLDLSGISLATLSPTSREKLLSPAARMPRQRRKSDFRQQPSSAPVGQQEDTQQAYQQMLECNGISPSTLDDEDALWGQQPVEDVIAPTHNAGVKEVVAKRGAETWPVHCRRRVSGCSGGETAERKSDHTTAAGDSFSAGYLAVRFDGRQCGKPRPNVGT
ncbi:PfkB family carbohydrate kinase [Escherichia coli]